MDERVLEKEWPALRAELSVTARAWRLKGLELLGVPPTALVALDLDRSSGVSPAGSTGVSPVVPDVPSRFNIPASKPRPAGRAEASERRPVLEIHGEDLNLFAGLPLFELA